MLKITKPAANRVDIEFSGTLDADAMRVALDDLIAKSEDVSGGRMLYTVTDFQLPTLGVLSDAGWLRTAAEIEGAVIPGIAIKSFELHETEAAEAWLAAG